jgi:RNA polymerase sigma-70 factor (ECF subfamily)
LCRPDFRFWRSILTKRHYLEPARDGDASAIENVVRELRPRLTKMAVFYARRSQEEPDDLLQEAWIGLLEALRELDMTIGDPQQYLIQRARWRLLDAIKYARVRRPAIHDNTDNSQLEPENNASPAEDWLATLSVADFAQRLQPMQQAVLSCLMNGLTWREAGHILGCTSANIAYHVRRIRKEYEAWNKEPTNERL